jgi:GxxExxY protein
MNADERRLASAELTQKIIGCAYTVSNVLGCGFLEKIYETALCHELRRNNLDVKQQHPLKVYYDDIIAGEYAVDILVNDEVIIELKAVKEFDENHMAQCMNYLKATGLKVCLLINFGKSKIEIKRIVNDY